DLDCRFAASVELLWHVTTWDVNPLCGKTKAQRPCLICATGVL
ncbi:MAG: hypothetical protein ACI90Y_002569, partial [Polaromonas sp.]